MNKSVTSKEGILQASLALIREQGLAAFSIRGVAERCHISVGSIYNYFESKSELVCATVACVWQDVFAMPEESTHFECFTDCVEWMFSSLRKGNETYPGFFTTHSMLFISDDKAHGRQLMTETWEHISRGLLIHLERDKQVDPRAFDGDFTPQCLTNLLFSLVLSALIRRDYDGTAAVALVKRLIYSEFD